MQSCRSVKSTDVGGQMQPARIVKDRHFFKPEEFIWNNPYRSSPRLYRYYHAANHHYQTHEAVQIHNQERLDKENAQKIRITKIIKNRGQTRQVLRQRQLSREALQNKTRGVSSDGSPPTQASSSLKHLHPASFNSLEKMPLSTAKSLRTFKNIDSRQNEFPLIPSGDPFFNSRADTASNFHQHLAKTSAKGKMHLISFDLQPKSRADGKTLLQ